MTLMRGPGGQRSILIWVEVWRNHRGSPMLRQWGLWGQKVEGNRIQWAGRTDPAPWNFRGVFKWTQLFISGCQSSFTPSRQVRLWEPRCSYSSNNWEKWLGGGGLKVYQQLPWHDFHWKMPPNPSPWRWVCLPNLLLMNRMQWVTSLT